MSATKGTLLHHLSASLLIPNAAIVQGVSRVNMQQILHSGYDMWYPVEDVTGFAPQTFASYYSQPYVAEFIGKTGGKTRVSELQVNSPNVVAYAAYDGTSSITRVAIVNLKLWDQLSGSERPVTSFELNVPTDVKSVTIKQLDSPAGGYANASSITWGGSQWTYQSGGKEVPVKSDTQTLEPASGKVTVPMQDSAAKIAFYNR